MELTLVRPERALLRDYLAACRETWGHVHDTYILHDPARFDAWKDSIFDDYAAASRGEGLAKGFVPNTTFWLLGDRRYLGTVNIRHRLTPRLAVYGGHAGIVLRLSARGKGLAHRALPLMLDAAGQLGLRDLLITCAETNAPSAALFLHAPFDRGTRAAAVVDGRVTSIYRLWFKIAEPVHDRVG